MHSARISLRPRLDVADSISTRGRSKIELPRFSASNTALEPRALDDGGSQFCTEYCALVRIVICALSVFWAAHSSAATCDNSQAGSGVAVSLPSTINYTGGKEKGQMLLPAWQETGIGSAITCKEFAVEGEDLKVYIEPAAAFTGIRMPYNGITYDVFSTGTPGVGVIAEVWVTESNKQPLSSGKQFLAREVHLSGSMAAMYHFGFRLRVQLVAYKKLAPGVFNFAGVPALASEWVGPPTAKQAVIKASVGSSSIHVKNAGCKLTMPSSVSLPRLDASMLPSKLSTAGETPFMMSVSCDETFDDYQVSYKMSDINLEANTTSTLSIDNAKGSASGIALQVLDGSSPVLFGPAASDVNRLPFGTVGSTGNSLTKPMTVRYIRTAAAVTPGAVRGGATITLTYQ